MDFGVRLLAFTPTTSAKLWRRGLSENDAEAVLVHGPVFVPQKAQLEERPGGGLRERPRRLLMIGRNRSGRLLTFVLELPDEDGTSIVVTGFESKGNELTWYRQRGGR